MNIITKIFTGIILISILSTLYCKSKEAEYKYTIFPANMFEIDFCKLQLIDIINGLRIRHSNFKCYNTSLDHEVQCNEGNAGLGKITAIAAEYFIGKGFNKTKIIKVGYNYIPFDEEFIFSIKFKEEYYDTLLELLNKQLGAENSNVNFRGYGEISWSDDPKHNSCILHIILSKRQQYDDPAKAEKGVCYLEIRTRARHPHVH